MKITEIDMTDMEMIKITGIIKGGECPICKVELLTPDEMLKHFQEDGECKDGLVKMIKESIRGDNDERS